MIRKICVVTGGRAEYGLLRWVMQAIKEASDLELQTVVTGMHLSPEFDLTYRAIEADGFAISRKIETLLSSDSSVGVAKSMGLGMIGFADAFQDLQPDILLVLGDRFEILPAVACALVARIPVAHLHGGEITEGAFDEAIRHSITKMSHLHFVAADEYRRRVIQLGEHKDRVFIVGGLGVDGILNTELLSRTELEASLGVKLNRKSLLVTFHPATLDDVEPEAQMSELLAALAGRQETTLIFTMPNADSGGRGLIAMVEQFVREHSNSRAFPSLGQLRYLSCLKHVDGVIGNSSSGLTEAPTFKIGTINIGDRQKGRLQARSVINCVAHRQDITRALGVLYSHEFQQRLSEVKNPYGDGGASKRVVEVLGAIDLRELTKKSFNDFTP